MYENRRLTKIGERHGEMMDDKYKPANRTPVKKVEVKAEEKIKQPKPDVAPAENKPKQRLSKKQKKAIATKAYKEKQRKLSQYKKELKRNATKSELLFKKKLILYRIKHTFQRGIIGGDNFMIADFYIPSLNLIVEIDGEYHNEEKQKQRDYMKDKSYHTRGFNVLRIKNEDVAAFDMQELKQSSIEQKFTPYFDGKVKVFNKRIINIKSKTQTVMENMSASETAASVLFKGTDKLCAIVKTERGFVGRIYKTDDDVKGRIYVYDVNNVANYILCFPHRLTVVEYV